MLLYIIKMTNILYILIIITNILVNSSLQTNWESIEIPKIATSYSTVTKHVPQISEANLLSESQIFNSFLNRPIDVASFLTVKSARSASLQPKRINRRKSAQLSWLDPENVSSEDDLFNSTSKAMEYLMELNASANQRTKKITKNTSYLCSESFEDEEFFIRSSNYPFNYPAYTTCEYTIKRKNETVCGIIFTILRFDLGASSDSSAACAGDKLLIGNQVLCGRLRKGTESFYRLTWPTLKITFSSGSGFGASGFLIKGKQTEFCLPEKPFPRPLASSVPCNQMITDTIFNLSSPSYPLEYPHELECHYEILQSNWDICGLLLTPSDFVLEGASYCMFDYVEIQGKRLCGNRTSAEPLYYMFEDKKISIRFRTDESMSNRGFSFEGKQVKCNDLEYFQPIHSPLTSVDSERESKAENDLHDIQDISHALSLLVKSGIPTNELHLSNREPKTVFGDDDDNDVPRFLVSNPPITGDEEDNEDTTNTSADNDSSEIFKDATVHSIPFKPFQKPLTTSIGEHSALTSSCDEQHSSRVFFIQSVNYPDSYPNNIQCTYYIRRHNSNVCQLRLTLEDVAIENPSNSSGLCIADYLDIAGHKVCGSHNKSIMYVTFTGETVIIRFNSDRKISDKGYLITVEQIDKECGKRGGKQRKLEDVPCDSDIRYDNFTIFSPGYPQFYPPNLHCTTTIHKIDPDIKSLEISLQEFAVESSPQCEKDYLSIGKLRFCGHRNGNSYMIPFISDSIPLTFVTSDEKAASGFKIRINQLSEVESTSVTPKCGGIYYSSTITLTSPQFPLNYDQDQHCMYTIVRNSPDVCQLQFKIIHFDVEPSPGCRTDYLQLGLRRLCGRNFDNEIHNYHFKTEKFTLIFHSDINSSGKGFRIEARQRSCQKRDDGSFNSSSVEDEEQSTEASEGIFPIQEPINNQITNTFSSNVKQNFINNDKRLFPNVNVAPSAVTSSSSFISNFSPFSNTKVKDDDDCNCKFYGIDVIDNNKQTFYKPQNSLPPVKPKGCSECKLYPISNPNTSKFSFYKIDSAESINSPHVIKSDDASKFKFRPMKISQNRNIGQSLSKKVHKESNSGIWINDGQQPYIPTYLNPFVYQSNLHQRNRHQAGRTFMFQNVPTPTKLTSEDSVSNDEITAKKVDQSLTPDTHEEASELQLNVIRNFPASSLTSALLAQTTVIKPTTNSLLQEDATPASILNQASVFLKAPLVPSAETLNENHLLELENESPNFDQSLKLCNKSISSRHFEMKSPGYPGPFYVDMHCFYLINRNDVSNCGLLLNIDMLDLPGSPPCLKTYLSISGRRFCGTKRNGISVVVPFSPSSPIVLEFKSDMFHSGAGFSLAAQQIPCNFTLAPGQNVFADIIAKQDSVSPALSFPEVNPNKREIPELKFNDIFSDEQTDKQNYGRRPAIRSLARGYITVPWTGTQPLKYPPYKRGLELVKLRKAKLSY